MPLAKPLVVFCDFDGTITVHDMVISICKQFCPPSWREIVDDILARKKSVKDGVSEMFAMIPSNRKNDIVQFAQETMRPREGFQEFLHFCKANGLRFVVCSGGIDFFVEPLMKPYSEFVDMIYSIPSDFTGPMIALRHNRACESEGTCKVKVMEEYPGSIRILIGDSITDLHGAHSASRVFARGRLKKYLDDEHVLYQPFETFYDVQGVLEKFKGTDHEETTNSRP